MPVQPKTPLRGRFTSTKVSPDKIRKDGTRKGKGFLGELPYVDGRTSTELSIQSGDVYDDGREALIPTLVPTLTPDEVAYLLSGRHNPKMRMGIDDVISRKAIDFARERLKNKKPFFALPEEEGKFKPIGNRPNRWTLTDIQI